MLWGSVPSPDQLLEPLTGSDPAAPVAAGPHLSPPSTQGSEAPDFLERAQFEATALIWYDLRAPPQSPNPDARFLCKQTELTTELITTGVELVPGDCSTEFFFSLLTKNAFFAHCSAFIFVVGV